MIHPIALTSIACKTMKALIKDALLKHLISKNLLSKQQHGFFKITLDWYQIECLNYWRVAYVNGDCLDVCYIDFAKAFDSLSIPKLIYKLKTFGIACSCLYIMVNQLFVTKKNVYKS